MLLGQGKGGGGGGGGELVSTDFGNEGILKALEENLLVNLGPSSSSGLTWTVQGHAWGSLPSLETLLHSPPTLSSASPRQFSTLLLSDLLYSTSSHLPLLTSILALLLPGGTAHLTAGLHGGHRGAVDRFVELARGKGCVVEEKEVVVWDGREEEWRVLDGEEKEEGGEGRVWRAVLFVGTEDRLEVDEFGECVGATRLFSRRRVRV